MCERVGFLIPPMFHLVDERVARSMYNKRVVISVINIRKRNFKRKDLEVGNVTW